MSGPIPARVDSAAKTILLDLIDDAVKAGWTLARICGVLELDRQRAWRWRHRQAADRLDDATPGGRPIHGLLAWEEAEILALFEEWGAIDLSHRKLAHRGSYTRRVWVSPSTVDRVLARNGLALQGLPRPPRSSKKPWPDWVEWRPNQLWCWDASHFSACAAAPIVYGIIDIVSRKWIASLLCAEATGTQVKVVFLAGLEAEGLLGGLEWRLDHPDDVDLDDDAAPVLLAVSDNGPEMRSGETRAFMALLSIGQHFGRPYTPTDQAWIETLWGHVKAENPHLLSIGDPAVLAAELERVRGDYNAVRLHEGIGYVAPDDEHEGRGDAIRQARRDGLTAADQARRDHHRGVRSDELPS
ncbi:MAG: integrase core domain-containing protein [Acidimicrobiales bacterium]